VISQLDKADEPFLVLEENWETVRFFLRVQTQWRMGGMGGFLGLDYTVFPIISQAFAIPLTGELLSGLQIMERAACKELNKRG
jgi:hypothetical protein